MPSTPSEISDHDRQIIHLAAPTNGEDATTRDYFHRKFKELGTSISKLELKKLLLELKMTILLRFGCHRTFPLVLMEVK